MKQVFLVVALFCLATGAAFADSVVPEFTGTLWGSDFAAANSATFYFATSGQLYASDPAFTFANATFTGIVTGYSETTSEWYDGSNYYEVKNFQGNISGTMQFAGQYYLSSLLFGHDYSFAGTFSGSFSGDESCAPALPGVSCFSDPVAGDLWTEGTFSGRGANGMASTGAFSDDETFANGSSGRESMFSITTTATPEPSTLLMLGSGMVGLAGVGRRLLA
jgi:hypothetical protein